MYGGEFSRLSLRHFPISKSAQVNPAASAGKATSLAAGVCLLGSGTDGQVGQLGQGAHSTATGSCKSAVDHPAAPSLVAASAEGWIKKGHR